jgi:DNA-binding transcriptional LysR family regulator
VPEHRGALQYDLLLTEAVCLVTSRESAFEGDVFDVSGLGSVPLILPSTPHGLRLLVESLATRHGFTPNIALECDGSISLTKRLVLANCGCTVLPSAAVVEDVAAGQLKSLRLENPEVSRDVGIFWPQNRASVREGWEVGNIIRQCTEALSQAGEWPGTKLAPG